MLKLTGLTWPALYANEHSGGSNWSTVLLASSTHDADSSSLSGRTRQYTYKIGHTAVDLFVIFITRLTSTGSLGFSLEDAVCWSFLGVLGGPFAGPLPLEDFMRDSVSGHKKPSPFEFESLARDIQRPIKSVAITEKEYGNIRLINGL